MKISIPIDDTVSFLAEASAIKLKLGAGEDNINLQSFSGTINTVETEQTKLQWIEGE